MFSSSSGGGNGRPSSDARNESIGITKYLGRPQHEHGLVAVMYPSPFKRFITNFIFFLKRGLFFQMGMSSLLYFA